MEQNLNSEILDKLTKVCICKGISRTAIKNGARTVADVQKVTGTGGDPCGGRRCTEKTQQLLHDLTLE